MPELRQQTGAAIPDNVSRGATAVFGTPTQPGSLVVVIATGTSLGDEILFGPSGFTAAPITRTEDDLTLAVWYRPNCPALSSVGVATGAGRDPMQIRALEYTGMAQTAVLDRYSVAGDNDHYDGYSNPQTRSGLTAQTTQADEVIIGVLANRYASTNQSGFGGGMALLSNTLTPSSDSDFRRCRLTVHHAFATEQAQWQLTGRLSTGRDWISAVLTFKGGTTGPARLVSIENEPMLTIGGEGDLTVFGPLVSEEIEPMLTIGGEGYIGPFAGQIRLAGPEGLLIGEGTDYRISKIVGLAGHDIRTSDSDFSRGDGAQRGVDLQSSRTIMIEVNYDDPDPVVHEQLLVALAAALVPRRDTDWPMVFRQIGQPLQQVWARPGALTREQNADDMLIHDQTIVLRCADPRIYSFAQRAVAVPVTPAGATEAIAVSARNDGNGRAYPLIRIRNTGLVDITSIELVNATADAVFRVQATILPGAELVGDMPAKVTAAPRSVVTVGGQSVYGGWVAPRDPFYIAPAPEAPLGVNALYLRTQPPGASVAALLEYRDTSST